MNKTELLMPAGDLKRLKIVINYGADAVYIGGEKYSLRYRASNFTLDDIREGVTYAHMNRRKVYVTVNMIFHDEDLKGVEDYLVALDEIGVDAIIVASPYLLSLKEKLKLSYEFHVSTQLSVLNSEDINYYFQLKADRVILARELSIEEIKQLSERSILPLEVFIHGAMCSNYSGRCTLSNDMTNRDANRGGCAHSCRWKYHLYAGEELISPNDQLFSFSSKDLNALEYINDLLECGISSLKVEGRMKSAYYLAALTKTYRDYLDLYYLDKNEALKQLDYFEKELAKTENRQSSSGFFAGSPDETKHIYGENGAGVTHEYVGDVLDYDDKRNLIKVATRNYIKLGDKLEILSCKKETLNQRFNVEVIYDEDYNLIEYANHPLMIIYLHIECRLAKGDFLRKVMDNVS